MLAAIISLLQDDVGPTPPPPRPSRLSFEMRGGGGPDIPMYSIADYTNVLGTFREVRGEHPVARAARRTRHLEEGLGVAKGLRESHERAMAAGLLLGAGLERARAADEMTATLADLEAARCAIEAMRAKQATEIQTMKAAHARTIEATARAGRASAGGGMLVGFLLGVGAAVLLTQTKTKTTTRSARPARSAFARRRR